MDKETKLWAFKEFIRAGAQVRRSALIVRQIESMSYLPYTLEEFVNHICYLISISPSVQQKRMRDLADSMVRLQEAAQKSAKDWENIKCDIEFTRKQNNEPWYAGFYRKNKAGYKR